MVDGENHQYFHAGFRPRLPTTQLRQRLCPIYQASTPLLYVDCYCCSQALLSSSPVCKHWFPHRNRSRLAQSIPAFLELFWSNLQSKVGTSGNLTSPIYSYNILHFQDSSADDAWARLLNFEYPSRSKRSVPQPNPAPGFVAVMFSLRGLKRSSAIAQKR